MAMTKQCRECKGQIPEDARRCMHCGARQGMGCLGWTVATLFTLMVISVVAVEMSLPPDSPAPAATSDAPANPDTSTEAKQACVQALQDAAKFPSSFDFSPFTDPPQAMLMNDGSYLVRVDFSAKNSFGNMLPQVGHCSVRDGVATVTEVDQR